MRMNWQKARWILAGLALVASVWLMSAGVKMGWLAAAFPVIGSMLLLVTAVLLVAPDTAVKIAEWIAKPFADLFYPSDEFEKPPLSYLLARRYSQERRVDAAVQEYEKILFYYPEERDAYLELIELAQRVGDEELREKYEGLLREREGPQNSSGQEKGDL
jgi:cell division protein FtsW (lipid II flippase)